MKLIVEKSKTNNSFGASFKYSKKTKGVLGMPFNLNFQLFNKKLIIHFVTNEYLCKFKNKSKYHAKESKKINT